MEEKAATETGLSRQLRSATEEAFKYMVSVLNALAIESDDTKRERTDLVRATISKINVVIEETKQRLSTRLKTMTPEVEKLILPEGIELPADMKEFSYLSVSGDWLNVKNVWLKVELTLKRSGTVSYKWYTAENFKIFFKANVESERDELTGESSVSITDWVVPALYEISRIEVTAKKNGSPAMD